MVKPPTRVKIGASMWTVAVVKDLSDASGDLYGRSSPRSVSIEMSASQDGQQMRDTLLHEVMHAICSNIPLFKNSQQEERVLRALAPWLLAVLRENNALTNYLIEK